MIVTIINVTHLNRHFTISLKDCVRLCVYIPSPWHFSHLSCHSGPLLKSLPGRPHCRKHQDTSFDILQSTTFPFNSLRLLLILFPPFAQTSVASLIIGDLLTFLSRNFWDRREYPTPVWSGIFSSSITFKFPCQTWPTFLWSIIKKGHKVDVAWR